MSLRKNHPPPPPAEELAYFGYRPVAAADKEKLVRRHFDLRPYGIIKMLDLVHPMYKATASYGHFGREPYKVEYGKGEICTAFSWEKTDKAALLRDAAGLKG